MCSPARVHASEEMYVQVAPGMRSFGRDLVPVDLAPSTIDVTTTPAAGLEATLSLLDPGARLSPDVVVRLPNPRICAAGLSDETDVVAGVLPSASGAFVLFIETRIGTVDHAPG